MKKNSIFIAASVGLVVLIGGYAAYDYFAGNHVQIEQVIPANAQQANAGSAATVQADKLKGNWTIQQPSNVYFSVKTSKEEVNFSLNSVKGSWQLDPANPANMKGEGTVDLATLSSGNPQRDNHIKSKDYLQTDTNPQATFKVKSFGSIAKEWKEGQTVPVNLEGTLTVKGISKDVTFASEALYSQDTLKLSGKTKVTFADFGMKNPHAVVLETENDVTVRLELNLKKA